MFMLPMQRSDRSVMRLQGPSMRFKPTRDYANRIKYEFMYYKSEKYICVLHNKMLDHRYLLCIMRPSRCYGSPFFKSLQTTDECGYMR
ncbi:protein of unknown function [Candidatus Nitrotoga arctica]|uniref:Uncharacterized protein n=1 Tax=Candidatus Nitrotoga arctica TaxID=453162 RepID=A0ABN8AR74_9PROT|nr:protein of unknown function [Candidatus Nitrotoga arctica]